MTLGLKLAGYRVVGALDSDSLAVETYRTNHPRTHVWERDIRTVPSEEVLTSLRLRRGELDLLAGCPPCQGFSTMRTRNQGPAVKDERNDLVFEFLRFVRDLLPKAVLMENVPGLASDRRMETFWEELTRLGYRGSQWILNAADYGVPQRRRRMLLMATRFGSVSPAPEKPRARTVAHAFSGIGTAGSSGDPLHDLPETRSAAVMRRIRSVPPDGGGRETIPAEEQLPCHQRCNGYKDVYGRMAWNKPAPTITGGCTNPSKGRFLHPVEHRAITLREAAALQGFPRRYHFSLRRGKGAASVLIGNAVPPEFVRPHARKIRLLLSKHGHERYDRPGGFRCGFARTRPHSRRTPGGADGRPVRRRNGS